MLEKSKNEVGREYEVLVDGYHNDYGVFFGRTYKDSVDVDGMIIFETEKNTEIGDMVRVKVTGSEGYDLTGEEI